MRLKCAVLGLTTLKVALHKAKGTPLPDGLAGFDELELHVGAADRRHAGGRVPARLHEARRRPGRRYVGVYNCGGTLYAIEDRCSHDDGPLCEGDWDEEHVHGRLPAPRLGVRARHRARRCSLPAYLPVETFPVQVVDGMIRVDVGD